MADQHQKETLRSVIAAGFRLVGRYIAWHPVAFALAVAGATVFASAIIGAAVFVGSIADNFVLPILEGGEPVGNRGLVAGAVLLGIATWKATGIVLRRTAAGFLQFRTQADIRQKLVDHQLSLTLAWYQERSVGDLLAVSDADARGASFVLAPLPYGTAAVVLLISTVFITFTVDLLLGVVVLLAIIAALAVDIWGAWLMFQGFERVQARRGAVSDVTHESFDGALTVKALGREAFETERVKKVSEALRDELVYVGVLRGNLTAAVDAILPLATVAILVLGALRFDGGTTTPGQLVTVAYLLSQLVFPVRIVGFVLWEMAAGVAAWHRVTDILDSDDVQSYGAIRSKPDPSGADIATTAVEFSYTSGDRVLTGVNLTIEPGTTVAVVGPTASGKSTLVMLLARLWDPASGVIKLDARDLRKFARSELPAEIAYVGQDTFLFDDSVTGNIGLGSIKDAKVIETAAGLAAATEFIEALPQGFNTRIGERGASLSGGQRQRIAIARALARQPRLLILDDATSAVDPTVESRILAALSSSAMPATIVMVAYRPSSIRLADTVVYVEGGRIVAHATHSDLMASQQGYAQLLQAYENDAQRRSSTDAGGLS